MKTFFILLSCLCTVSLVWGQTATTAQTTILEDKGAYTIDYSDLTNLRWAFERAYKVVVAAEEDVAFLKYVSISVNKEYKEDLTAAAVEIRSVGGGKITYDLSNFEKEPFDVEITDYNLEVDGLRVTDTLVVSYRTLADLSNRMHRWDLQYAYPVLRSELSFLVPEAFKYKDILSNDQYLVSETAISNTVSVNRSQRLQLKGVRVINQNIPAYRIEEFAPSLVESRPSYFFTLTDLAPLNYDAFLPDWSTQASDLMVNDYWGKQFRLRSNYSWLARQASNILRLKTDERTKVWKCYELVHKLFSWDGSLGLFPSHTIMEMQNVRIVNKAAMNQALLALLEEAKLRAYPVLVNTIDLAPAREEIPDVYQFNHFVIVVGIGNDALYLDAGDPQLPIGLIDQRIRKKPAALIRNYQSSFVDLGTFRSKSMFTANLRLQEDGSGSGSISCSYMGYDAQAERTKLSEDRQARYWKDRAAVLSSSIRIDSVKFDNVTNLSKPLSSTVFFHTEASDEMEFSPFFYSFFRGVAFADTARNSDIIFPFALEENFILNISHPSSLSASVKEAPKRLALDGGDVEFDYLVEQDERNLNVRGAIKINNSKISKEKYDGLLALLAEVQRMLDEQVVITKGRSGN